MHKAVVLHQFPHPKNLPNLSPFCMKLETYFRMANIPYVVNETVNPSKAPKGKMPFIEVDGQILSDSSVIVEHFQNYPDYDLDKHLSEQQRTLGLLIQRLCEDHLYWGIVYSRWQDPDGFDRHWKPLIGSSLPKPLRFIIYFIRRKALKELHAQGMGRHSTAEVYAFCTKDIIVLNEYLSMAKPFLFGERPSSFDAVVYGTVGSLLYTPWDYPLKTVTAQFDAFENYYQHMTKSYFPDLLKQTSKDNA